MRPLRQIDCFKVNMKCWKLLAVWPPNDMQSYYRCYQMFFTAFILLNNLLATVNFIFLPRQLDMFIDEMIFYFTELAVTSKLLTFLFMREKILKILSILESDMFQPESENGLKAIDKAKKFNVRYFKIVAAVSATAHFSHIVPPILLHFILHVKLELPVCNFSFLSDDTKQKFIYPLYEFQALYMHSQVLFNISIDTFVLGILIYAIAQLDILDDNLRRVTVKNQIGSTRADDSIQRAEKENALKKLNDSIIHYGEVGQFCDLVQDVFSITLFVQFGVASCIICVVLFRFTLPAPLQYFVFLGSYMIIMILQILVPCWFGTRIQDKSQQLSQAVYDCDWTAKSRYFKSSLRLFVERANKPLSITAGKMFPLSLTTFTSIMNSSYSFFTLLRHMQSRQN
uniref:Odorant receptor n=1 Tax=Cydia fagiglandana TaxID=1458189 RepID=A0A223HD44_9NEOP|nr:putative odorant receptor OR13 [Cydia fagiglandana]